MFKVLLGVARVNFLTLSLVCVALAAALGWLQQGILLWSNLLLVLVMALAAHISVNAFNEYFDFRSGLDFLTPKTPFSGGSGSLVANPEGAYPALTLAILTLVMVTLIGLWLAAQVSWLLLLLGIPGVFIIYAYTNHINRFPFLCLLAPGVGFGLLMTLGASWVLSVGVTPGAVVLAVIMTLLVSNLLLLNQFPDVEADRQVGRRHLPILWGRRKSAVVFMAIHILSYLTLLLGVMAGWLPEHTLLGLFSGLLLIKLLPGVWRYADEPQLLPPYLGLNVMLIHFFPLLIIAGLLWAAA
ncbi:1,4-dihydroxy-2-naphthoate prenyltransferase [Aliidiomarina minuta]|uniref:1,4-dihydroxy-2-naphthoate prenyltransferase n=1 Tax=Aliidiomarina minuta TaxID=880057 RepID=A0A432W625_9GAMM|nr:prenyltransferase [Aliidiomarina minuta]RUO25481.1 1,4-dihydroxy-2-naphthoate prenyltransferase [Aliidiomarina minuta]